MPKKFFDIIPPKETKPFFRQAFSRKEVSIPVKHVEKKDIKKEHAPKITREFLADEGGAEKKKKFRPIKTFFKVLFLGVFLLVILGFGAYSYFSRAEVIIWPKTEELTLETTISVRVGFAQADFSQKIIPGEIFKDQRSDSEDFPSSGQILKEEKAKGTIRVYNAYSASPQALVLGTRFVSADERLFKLTKKIIIPGGTYDSKGKLVPGSIDAEIQAAEPGDGYNIGPTAFSIPGFAGTEKYTAFYGKSFNAMSGGFKGQVPQVTALDLTKAKSILTDKIKEESKNFLKNINPKDFILLDGAISYSVIKETPSVEVGAQAQTFNFQAEIKSEGIAFLKEDINNFARDIINLNIPAGKKLEEQSLKIDYAVKEITSDNLVLNLRISAKIYQDLNLEELRKAIIGKSFKEVKAFLGDQPEISRVEIESFPFWVERIPENLEKVRVTISLDPVRSP